MRINRKRWTIATGACFLLAGWSAAVRGDAFATVDEALAFASKELDDEKHSGHGALIVSVDLGDEGPRNIKAVIVMRGGGSYYRCFTTHQVWLDIVPAKPGKIQIRVDGHHEINEEIVVETGTILILDDLWPDPVMDRDGAEVLGIVKLEDGEDPSGLCMSVGGVPAETDAHGRFHATVVGAGTASVFASFDGYTGLYQRVKVERGEKRFVALEGWRQRYALVQWAYQPDGSSNLSSGLESGVAVLAHGHLNRVNFEEGFAEVQEKSDIQIRQVQHRLLMQSSRSGRNYESAIIELPDIDFDEVRRAPNVEFPKRMYELTDGAVYIIQCADGEHFAKMQVLEIIDNEQDYARLVAEMARE